MRVTDSDGNNVGTGGDDVSIASTVGVLSEVIDNQDGTYTATLTTSPQEGMAVITITVNGADNSTSTEVTLGTWRLQMPEGLQYLQIPYPSLLMASRHQRSLFKPKTLMDII